MMLLSGVAAAVLAAACGSSGGSLPSSPTSPTPAPGCPEANSTPLVTGSADKWTWVPVGTPLGDAEIFTIGVDPQDAHVWYVGGSNALFLSRDAGHSWQRALTGYVEAVEIVRSDPCTAYVAVNTPPAGPFKLYRTNNRGLSWTAIHEVAESIRSIHVSARDGLLLIGTQLTPRPGSPADALYRSADGGGSWSRVPYDGAARGLIPWDIEEDATGRLYVGTEIYNHPQPYRAPLFRSLDRGVTWQDATGTLPWHVGALQSHPSGSAVYALTEGAGLYVSRDGGANWSRSGYSSFALDLLLDRSHPNRLYGGEMVHGGRPGGAFASTNDGEEFHEIGLNGEIVGSLATDGTGSTLFAACYQAGVFWAQVPNRP
jgi:photosystem II stability/assembly factor-like uncharacterized protein